MEFNGSGGLAGTDPFANFVGDRYAANNAAYAANQAAMQQAGQYNPFAAQGGFGVPTANYAALGAAYGRMIPGGNIYAAQAPATPAAPFQPGGGTGDAVPGAQASTFDDRFSASDPAASFNDRFSAAAPAASFNDRFSAAAPAASFNDRFSAAPAIVNGLQPQFGDYAAFPNAISAGVDPGNRINTSTGFSSRFGPFPDPGVPMNTPADFPGWKVPTPIGPQSSVRDDIANALMQQAAAQPQEAWYGQGVRGSQQTS